MEDNVIRKAVVKIDGQIRMILVDEIKDYVLAGYTVELAKKERV